MALRIGAPETLRMVPAGPPPPYPHLPPQREAYEQLAQRPVTSTRSATPAPGARSQDKTQHKSIDVRV